MEKRKVYRLLVVLLSLALIMTVFANLVGAEGEELVNHPPIVETYAFQITTANTSFTIDLLEFCNDPDPDDVLTILSINGPSHGTAILNRENGTVYYTPDEGYVGYDYFTYTVSDGKASTQGPVQIQILEGPLFEYKPLKPVLESVTYYGQLDSGEHAWEAHWGWLSENEADVEALVCKFSGTVIGADNFPTTFAPGRQRDMFSTIFTSANLVWTLKGPDGSQRTATAARTPIPDDPEPTTGHLTIRKQLQGGGSDDAKFQIAIRPLAARSLNEGQEEPTAPEGPVEPEEPTAPEQPQEPEEPTKPEGPVEPVEPTTIEQADPGTLPKTSAIDGSLVLGSLLTLTGLWLSKKRS